MQNSSTTFKWQVLLCGMSHTICYGISTTKSENARKVLQKSGFNELIWMIRTFSNGWLLKP